MLYWWQWQSLLFGLEEASRSQSECETEDSNASPGKHSAAKSSAAKATRDDEQSDDSTDVEDSETSKQNIVHAGDGDKPDGTLVFQMWYNKLTKTVALII